jgi:hypothetical protein
MREAKLIGELPTPEMRRQACAEAATVIGAKLRLNVVRSIPFGAPVYEAFGMKRPDASLVMVAVEGGEAITTSVDILPGLKAGENVKPRNTQKAICCSCLVAMFLLNTAWTSFLG